MLQATKTQYIPTDVTAVKASKAQLLTYIKVCCAVLCRAVLCCAVLCCAG